MCACPLGRRGSRGALAQDFEREVSIVLDGRLLRLRLLTHPATQLVQLSLHVRQRRWVRVERRGVRLVLRSARGVPVMLRAVSRRRRARVCRWRAELRPDRRRTRRRIAVGWRSARRRPCCGVTHRLAAARVPLALWRRAAVFARAALGGGCGAIA
eukprot:186424-Prymnesium_polylepis.1